MKKLSLFVMSEKGFAVLRSVHECCPELIDYVMSAPDKAVAKDYFAEIREYCEEAGIRFLKRGDAIPATTDYAFAIAWRWMINDFLGRLIVFHDSLLPRYRGFNPLVTSLLNGDREIGVTALHATAEYDRGDIVGQSSIVVDYPITIQQAIDRILGCFTEVAVGLAEQLRNGTDPAGVPQDDGLATYSLWRDSDDYWIDWRDSSAAIRRKVDALGFPYLGAAARIDGVRVRVLIVEELADLPIANRDCGKVISMDCGKPVVVCGSGLLRIDRLQDDEGNPMLPLPRFRVRFKGAPDT